MSSRRRLDQYLVDCGHYDSRARSRDAILRGTVKVDGVLADKPSQAVTGYPKITIDDAAKGYVSRAALKLKHALQEWSDEPLGDHALDIGASTGGFTQVLLEAGLESVVAVDVGHGQLVGDLKYDPRVTNLEGLNARNLDRSHLPHPVDLIVCDASFISLKLVLPAAMHLAEPGALLIAVIKPQFEVGRDRLGKGGIVRDRTLREAVVLDISNWLRSTGWRVLGTTPSPIPGGDGNEEYLIAARKG